MAVNMVASIANIMCVFSFSANRYIYTSIIYVCVRT